MGTRRIRKATRTATTAGLPRAALERRVPGRAMPADLDWDVAAAALAAADREHAARLEAFRAAHPGIDVHPGEFSEWYADIPMPDDDRYDSGHLHEPRLGDLLDRLDSHLGSDTG